MISTNFWERISVVEGTVGVVGDVGAEVDEGAAVGVGVSVFELHEAMRVSAQMYPMTISSLRCLLDPVML
jgi:hypothetical protein